MNRLMKQSHPTNVEYGIYKPFENETKNAFQLFFFRHKIVALFDLTFLKSTIYVNIVLGITFASISDNSFLHLQSMYLLSELSYTKVSIDGFVNIPNDVPFFEIDEFVKC